MEKEIIKRYTNLGEYPGKSLEGEKKRKKMYHYTKLETFYKIWESKTLLFSDVKGTNDILEANKDFRGYSVYQLKQIGEIVNSYKQISFKLDDDSYMKGGMSNLMWGHYGDNGRGVCIELDFEKLNFGDSIMHQEISYEDTMSVLKMPQGICTPEDCENFLLKNKTKIFFTKLKQWEAENEYRFVSKKEEKLDISNAITAIWVTHNLQKSKTKGNSLCLMFTKLLKIIANTLIRLTGNLRKNAISELSKGDSFSLAFDELKQLVGESITIYDFFWRSVSDGELIPCRGCAIDYQLAHAIGSYYKKTGIKVERSETDTVIVTQCKKVDGKLYNHDELIKIGMIFYPDKEIVPRSIEEWNQHVISLSGG